MTEPKNVRQALEEIRDELVEFGRGGTVLRRVNDALASGDPDAMREAVQYFDMLETKHIQRMRGRDDDPAAPSGA